MIIFYIDTSSSFLYSAIYKDGKVINERRKNLSKDLSRFAIDEISKMFNEVNIKPKDIGKIILVNGPGSFTGVRIGVTIAKLMAFTLSIPVSTISSLEAMNESVDVSKISVPIINARRNACYAAIYDNGKVILDGCYLSLDKLNLILYGLNREYIFISNDKFDFDTVEYNPNFKRIIEKYKDKETIPAHQVNPNYLKLTEAEEIRMKEEV